MTSLAKLTKVRASFEKFLDAKGAEILQPTNEWEVLRFKTPAGVSIIYRNAKDGLTFTGQAGEAFDAFSKQKNWDNGVRTKGGLNADRRDATIRALIARDGECCFFCHLPIQDVHLTIEHLVAKAHGGPNHRSNLVLAHAKCNGRNGHMSAMDKIRVREQNRIKS